MRGDEFGQSKRLVEKDLAGRVELERDDRLGADVQIVFERRPLLSALLAHNLHVLLLSLGQRGLGI